jgi:hypothetical protein
MGYAHRNQKNAPRGDYSGRRRGGGESVPGRWFINYQTALQPAGGSFGWHGCARLTPQNPPFRPESKVALPERAVVALRVYMLADTCVRSLGRCTGSKNAIGCPARGRMSAVSASAKNPDAELHRDDTPDVKRHCHILAFLVCFKFTPETIECHGAAPLGGKPAVIARIQTDCALLTQALNSGDHPWPATLDGTCQLSDNRTNQR